MRRKHIIAILATMILSTTCILGVSLYDTKNTTVSKLYKAVSSLDMDISKTEVHFNLLSEGEKITEEELYDMNHTFSEILSHDKECSKFCTQSHTHVVSSSMWQEKDMLHLKITSNRSKPAFIMDIQSTKSTPEKLVATMQIEGNAQEEEIREIDNIRELTWKVYKRLKKAPKESIIFHASINKKLSEGEMERYAHQLFKALNAQTRQIYQDDLNETTAAFYGYTKAFSQYIFDNKGKKSNLQIAFSYDEIKNTTFVVIAFPFYNEVF